MHIYPALTLTWAVLLLLTVVVMVCRATVTQHEQDQLFLNDEHSMSLNNREHHRLLRVIGLIKPIYQIVGVATIAITGIIVGIYIAQLWPYLQIVHMR